MEKSAVHPFLRRLIVADHMKAVVANAPPFCFMKVLRAFMLTSNVLPPPQVENAPDHFSFFFFLGGTTCSCI